jgi:hypothetical protein
VITKAAEVTADFEAAELYAAEGTADLYAVAADLSATAGDIAADIAEGRACPGTVTRARRLLDALADARGELGENNTGDAPDALFDAAPYRRNPR